MLSRAASPRRDVDRSGHDRSSSGASLLTVDDAEGGDGTIPSPRGADSSSQNHSPSCGFVRSGTIVDDISIVGASRADMRHHHRTLSQTVSHVLGLNPFSPRGQGQRRVMSEVHSYPIKHPYPRKPRSINYDMDHPVAFIKDLMKYRGTVLEMIWPQLAVALMMVLGIKSMQIYAGFSFQLDPRLRTVHQILGSILAFITVFRTNRSYDAYIEGRRLMANVVANLRMAMMDMYINDPRDGKPESRDRLVHLAEDFRRKCNVLFALIRQATRENLAGFCPGSGLGPFNADTFILDPTRPRLVDLLTEEEHDRYKRMRVNARPVVVLGELNLLAYQMISCSNETNVRINIDQKFQEVLASWNGMMRVVDMRIPFAYTHVVNMIMFVFVYSTPFLYASASGSWGGHDVIVLSTLILGMAFYGLEAMCVKICNPFGWDREDHDMEAFGIALNLDGMEIAKLAGVYEPKEFMCDELFDSIPDKYASLSYKAYKSARATDVALDILHEGHEDDAGVPKPAHSKMV